MSQASSKDDTSASAGFFSSFGRVFLGAEAHPEVAASNKVIGRFTGLKDPMSDRDMTFVKGIEALTKLRLDSPKHPDIEKVTGSLFKLLHNTSKRTAPLGEQIVSESTTTHRFPYAHIIPEASSTDGSVHHPPVEQVFDRLLGRQESKRTDHSEGVSGLAYALAQVLQLSLSRPSRDHPSYNETSAYLDLSPLYGTNNEEEKQVREIDGRGMLKPDYFFENRAISPATCVLLILLNRNHNYIARRLLSNNEKSKWFDLSQLQESGPKTSQDDSIFEIARSINCAQFKNIIQEDFLKGLMGLRNVGPSPNIDFTDDLCKGKDKFMNSYESIVEFSQLYHFPSLMHEKEEDWIGQQPEDSAPDAGPSKGRKTFDQCPTYPIKDGETAVPLVRLGSEGRFSDDGLAHILLSATEAIAGAPGARRTPMIMRNLNIALMNQARRWKVCTMNNFRSFLGLKQFESFREWNPDVNVSDAAERLYGNINNLELYPGLQAEANIPGSGFCLGYTQTYGLLVAIVTAIRNDPRFTVHMNPERLTEWGFKACNPRRDNGAYGAMLPNLILRNLHRNYGYNNIYGLFPLTVPATTKKQLLELNPQAPSLYDMEKPALKLPHILTKHDDISSVLNNPEVFATTYERDLKLLTKGYGFMLGFDDKELHAAELNMSLYALMPDTRSFSEYATFLRDTAQGLIEKFSANGHKTIDVISDVIIPTCTRWVCHTICDVSLQVDDVKELNKQFYRFSTLYAFIFRKFDTADGWGAREDAITASKELAELIENRVEQAINPPSSNGFVTYLHRLLNEFTFGHDLGKPSSRTFLERLSKTSDTVGKFGYVTRHADFKKLLYPKDVEKNDPKTAKGNLRKLRLTANVLGLCVVLSVNYAQACSQAVGFYLHQERDKERKTIIDLIGLKAPGHDEDVMNLIRDLQTKNGELYGSVDGDNDAHKIIPALRDFLLMGYIREAQRIGQPFGLIRRALKDFEVGGLELKKDDLVFADFGSMHMDSDKFPRPENVIPTRIIHSIQGLGVHKCPGLSLIDNTMVEVLFSMIFRLEKLHCTDFRGLVAFESRSDDPEDHKLKSLDPRLFVNAKGEITPYPTSLRAKFEKFNPPPNRDWEVPPFTWTWWKMLIDLFIVVLALLFIWRMLPSRSMVTRSGEGTTREIVCNLPTTVFQRWDINTIVPGLDGQPSPIEYTLEHRKPHRLSVIDIDERDMQLSVYVDGIIRGRTTDFELDKSVSCGEDVQVCLGKNFSGGVVVIPPGRHTVKIVWCGKEYLPGTEDLNWGDRYSRRLMWQLEYCA